MLNFHTPSCRCAAYLFLLPLVGCARGIHTAEMAQCAASLAPAARLACYDKLGDQLGLDTASEQGSTPRDWRTRTELSPIDDSTNVHLSVPAQHVFVKSSGEKILPTLYLRCKENTTALIAVYDTYLGERAARVSYRIDARPFQSESWQLSTAHNMVGLWNGRVAIPVIKELFGAEQLLLQVTPLGENRVTSTFPIAGLEKAIEPLRTACHW